MNIKNEYMNQAIKIAKNIDKLNIITEHTQFSIAATSVLIMAELNSITNLTKKSLKNIFGVSNVTISKAYKKLERIRHILIDDNKINKLVQKLNKINESVEISDLIKERMEKFGLNENKEIKQEIKKDSDSDYFDYSSCDEEINVPKIRLDKIYKKQKNISKTKIICIPKKKEKNICIPKKKEKNICINSKI